MEPKALKKGDACPRCQGTFKAARIPTDLEHAKAFDKENPGTLPEGADTASPAFRAEHGDLHRCVDCGYQTRFPPDAPAADGDAADGDGAPAAGKSRKKTAAATT